MLKPSAARHDEYTPGEAIQGISSRPGELLMKGKNINIEKIASRRQADPKSANEDISNENHIENISCSSKIEAVDEGKDIKKRTHMTHKLDQWSSTPFGLNGFMESMENAAFTSPCNRTGVHFGGAVQNARTHNAPPLAGALGLRNGRWISANYQTK